ncbi:MAG: hypothetical protein BEN19_06930 [Epulopiscium sp. Nuni2H_MBin003]|nr:MAG: hypothetical protein BEN19_06930 [Epulopiscium sp. Nuni2H_MBin003]
MIYGRYRIESDEKDVNSIISKVAMAHKYAKNHPDYKIFNYGIKLKEEMLEETKLTNKMEDALYNEEFKVFLQPKYSIADNTIVGAEALVRWIEKDGKMIFPDKFIPLFERNGFITRIDKYMLERVCMIIQEWITQGIPPICISVNFSRIHTNNPDFVEEIRDIISKYDIPTEYIEIELTESTILDKENDMISIFEQFKNNNIMVAMDDFGSGYSSLGFLKNFALDVIKLDKSFLSYETDKEKGRVVIRNIVKMIQELGIKIVAEGVETKEQVDFLRGIGCDMAQGYFFARPLPTVQFNELLTANLE